MTTSPQFKMDFTNEVLRELTGDPNSKVTLHDTNALRKQIKDIDIVRDQINERATATQMAPSKGCTR